MKRAIAYILFGALLIILGQKVFKHNKYQADHTFKFEARIVGVMSFDDDGSCTIIADRSGERILISGLNYKKDCPPTLLPSGTVNIVIRPN